MLSRIARFAAFAILALTALPAQARVTITFWSYEHAGRFPHAFITMHGTLDRSGKPIKESYGFTPKSVTPAMLIGNVAGKIDYTTKAYVDVGTPHFSVEISDAQYDAVTKMVREWDAKGGNTYSLNKRNCVHFSAEAMRLSGLRVVEDKKLMKKPRSFTQSIETLNKGRVKVIETTSAAYLAATPALVGVGR
ncbi:hypothetical protein [Sphingomonas sp.]|uniref:hypothetical protein n=1 Tax=Sphingomonas sp. TaxID=28214 RepID=UPI001EC67FC1|nr:hypothetical protein [Sphingomonas sp.]MBX3594867.1 hypothetical protein [Sphingomonas sp.]